MESVHKGVTLSGLLGGEHQRIESLWGDAMRILKAGAPADSTVLIEAFARELRRHIRDEEEVLFPAFEEHTGMKNGGPTAVMRMEHRQMEMMIEEILAILRQDGASALLEHQTNPLSTLIENHDKKEEGMLYPMMDRAFGEAESSTLLARTSLAKRGF